MTQLKHHHIEDNWKMGQCRQELLIMSLNNAVQMQCKYGANSSSKRSLHLLLSAIGKYGPTKYNWQRLIKGVFYVG